MILKTTLIVVLSLGLVLHDPFAGTANVDDLRREQQQRQMELEKLNEQIQAQQREINRLATQQNSLQNQLAIFAAQINQTKAQIAATEATIEITNEQIRQLRAEIVQKEREIQRSRERLAELIRTIYEMDRNNSGLIAIMNNNNLSDFLNSIAQTHNLQGQSYELLQEIKMAKLVLEDKQRDVERKRDELMAMRDQMEEQNRVLVRQSVAREQLLTQTRGQEQTYRQLLAQTQEQESKIEQEIRELENRIRSQLGERTSPGQRGVFVWPMRGILTQRYGRTGFTALGYDFHNGIDVAAAPGTPIVSAADGVVTATDSSNFAYGNWVTVEHSLPGGRQVVTLYAHMLRISVSPGQQVAAGQLLGTQGNSGNTTRLLYGPQRGFHLHFTVFDKEGFRIVRGAHGNYRVPVGYTYDPMDFL